MDITYILIAGVLESTPENNCRCAQMIAFYFCSPRVTRSVVYGPKPRNRLDIYLPRNHARDRRDPLPVVIFITGTCRDRYKTLSLPIQEPSDVILVINIVTPSGYRTGPGGLRYHSCNKTNFASTDHRR